MTDKELNERPEGTGLATWLGLFLLFAIALIVIGLFGGCVATKSKSKAATKTELSSQSEQVETNVSSAKTEVEATEKVDYSELIAEWSNENIEWQEQKFDSLGNLISQINATTTRSSGRDSDKKEVKIIQIGITQESLDSTLDVRLAQIKQQETKIEKEYIKVGLAWWQKALMWLGGLGLVGLVVWFLVKINFRIRKWI